MILCDHEIEKALQDGELIIEPLPESSQLGSSSIDLRVGSDFIRWNDGLSKIEASVDLDSVDIAQLMPLTTPVTPTNGVISIEPEWFVLVRTREIVCLPLKSKLAARVEGRSTQARLGMGVHITAPTIHAGFRGAITLEIINHGPFILKVRPNESKLCQLIIERVSKIPSRNAGKFLAQSSPLGTSGGPPRSR